MRQIVLVGLMGSGKSTVGARIALRRGLTFVDVDVVIATETGKTVRELWNEGGEAAYRRLESDAVLQVLRSSTPTVLAAPAGVILDPVVRTALADAFVVWLRADPGTLAGRVRPDDHRPLLGERPIETLAAMSDARSNLYANVANATFDTDGCHPDAIADAIVDLLADGRADAEPTNQGE